MDAWGCAFPVIHHTDLWYGVVLERCNPWSARLQSRNGKAHAQRVRRHWQGPGFRAGEFVEGLTIADEKQAIVDDVERIRDHPLVPKTIPVYGFIYDVRSGKLVEVADATEVGKTAQQTSVDSTCL